MALKNKEEPRVLAIILGGGKGTRLYPLTKERSKPAVPFGGKYRIVDIPISNCINSGYKKIYLLTQFNSASLHLHINNSYNFDRFSDGFVEILAAEQTLEHSGWYEGTADAVRKNFGHFRVQRPTHYIILSGDQLYKMNLKDFMNKHIESGAEITIAAKAVNRRDASGFGIMQVDDANRITAFMEKPAADMNIDAWKIPEKSRGDLPASLEYLASMGIYIFNDYWEDIGTIRSFYEATLDLTNPVPNFNLYEEDKPIYTQMRNLPPSKINNANMTATLASEGCVIEYSRLQKSVIGIRSIINEGCDLNGVVMMGADFYESEDDKAENKKKKIPDLGIGKNCKINKAIIDKNAHIGNNCCININGKTYEDGDHGLFYSSDGIIVIRKGAVIPDGTVI